MAALTVCFDALEAAGDQKARDAVMWELPCRECSENGRCLTAKRKDMGPLLYDREMLTTPRGLASSLFPRERFASALRPDLVLVDEYVPEPGERVVIGWDLAWSERTGGDYLAYVCAVQYPNRQRRILDINRWRGVAFTKQVQMIAARHKRMGAALTVIEEVGAQSAWVQEAKTILGNQRVIGHTARGKDSLAHGIPALLTDLDQGRWEFPVDQRVDWLITECGAFGWEDDRLAGVGEHDDLVMAWWHCRWGLAKWSVGTFSAPDLISRPWPADADSLWNS